MKLNIKSVLIFFPGIAALIILFSFLGCVNSSEQISKFANSTLDDSLKYYKASFIENFEKSKFQNKENEKTIKLKTDIFRLDNYINYKNDVLKAIKDQDLDIASIREMFIEKHVGDSIYYSFTDIFMLASNCAKSPAVKQYISQESSSAFANQSVDAWSNSVFGANNATAVTWILKGIQIEIYKIGAVAFSDN